MKITIDNFENFVEPKIIKRGLEYYKNKFVENFNKIAKGHYIAQVSGTDDYEVEMQMEENEIVTHFCSCPYDYGEFCKHKVAVLYTILDRYHTITAEVIEVKPKNKTKKVAPRTSKKSDISDVLGKISHQKLKDFVLKQTTVNKDFKQVFLMNFVSLTGENTSQFYHKQIGDIFRSGKDRYGFIEYYAMRNVGKKLLPYIDEANKYLDGQDFRTAFHIAVALLEKSVQATESCDDSDGYITILTDGCFDIFDSIVRVELHEDFRKEFLQYCLDTYDSNKFSGWDWHVSILIITLNLIKDKKEADEVLIKITEDYNEDEYGQDKLYAFKYDVLLKWKGYEKAQEFLYANLNNPDLRKKAINEAIHNFDYEKAKKLASDGAKLNTVKFPGLKKIWMNFLLKIAELENDAPNVILYARYLLVDNFNPERDYYQLLKEYVAEENWKAFIDEMISDILKSPKYYGKLELAADIYVKEKRWGNLLELLKKSSSIYFLNAYEGYIVTYFPDELVEIYAEFVTEGLETASDRTGYRNYCRYLKKIKNLGALEKTEQMIDNFKRLYPKRRALLEELNKV